MYSLSYLESLPTLCVGQVDDLKIETSHIRVWLSRCTVADGEPYDNKVSIEQCIYDKWVVVDEYEAT
jgi:hypothetical protein